MGDRTDNSSQTRRGLIRGLRGLLARARLSLAWEAVWPAVWPAAGIAGAFVALALLDIFQMLPAWFHTLFLAGFAAAFGFALYRAARTLTLPSRDDALRRIELASGLEHRPLEALQDRLPDGVTDPMTRALWEAHQRQMAQRIRNLRTGVPQPGLARRDPLALRFAVALMLVVGAVAAGPETVERLGRAFVPEFGSVGKMQEARLELWIAPPEYTRLPPLFPIQIARDHASALNNAVKPLQERAAGADGKAPDPVAADLVIPVPEGSTLTATVSGGGGDAVLELDGVRTPFEALDGFNSRLQTTVAGGGMLTVLQDGRTLGSWRIESKPDLAPEIAFDGPPAATQRGTLRLAYGASDDYGITEIRGEMRRTYERGEVVGKEVSSFELPTPSLNAREVKEASFQEIAPHPWAGLPVIIRLTATDAKGQTGFSEEVRMVLPERDFQNPVAKKIIAERRRLTTQPERRPEIIDAINDIASQTGAYKDDTVVFLGLVMARSRLFHEKDDSAIPPVRDLLWDTALRVEDGQLSHAERELVRAQEALMDALARNAPDEELERLMQELQAAMDQYMRELAKKLAEAPETDQAMPLDPTQRILDTADIQRMMDQIRQMMQSGARDAARQMLSQLRNMMEALRNAQVMRGNPDAQRNNQAMEQLQEMIRRQNELMDRTFRQSQGNNGQNSQQMMEGAEQQRQLREMLRQFQEMMQGMMPGDSPGMQSLGQAGRSMEDAEQSLGQGQPGDAVGSQGQALEALQRAGRGMMQQMMNEFARGSGIGMERQFNPLRSMRDPLGREWQGEDGSDTRRVTIPDQGAVERAQEIMEELRRRAGQRGRPQIELDYINRLLQRF
ncbi:MAG: TIGR02302 family protein [Rhodospirillaceae bacterium]